MRIALVTETYLPQVNGVSRTLSQLVRVLSAAGDAVLLVQPNYGTPPAHEPAVLARAVRLPFYPEIRVPVPPFGRVRRAIDSFQPDVVHIATEATLGLAVLRYARRRRVPVVSSFHTNFGQYAHHYRVPWVSGMVRRYLRWFHNATRETYVPSHVTLAELATQGYRNLVRWPRGVDSRLFRPDRPGRQRVREAHGIAPDAVVIGHVSRIAAEKNVAYLGAALAEVVRARPGTRLLIVGDGPERPALEAELGPAAVLAGYRTGDDLADHYAAADVFAFASRSETFGNVILEALASGLPVVAIRAGGPGELIQPEADGFLVDPDAPPAVFAERLVTLVDDAGLRRRMAGEARRQACARSWDDIMLGLRARYAALVDGTSGEAAS